MSTRKWSVGGLSTDQLKEIEEKMETKRAEMMTDPAQKAAMMERFNKHIEETCPDGNITFASWKGMTEARNGKSDEEYGGHWIMDDAATEPLFMWLAGIYGDGTTVNKMGMM